MISRSTKLGWLETAVWLLFISCASGLKLRSEVEGVELLGKRANSRPAVPGIVDMSIAFSPNLQGYAASIFMGTPMQKVNCLVSTSSSDLLVWAGSNNSAGCDNYAYSWNTRDEVGVKFFYNCSTTCNSSGQWIANSSDFQTTYNSTATALGLWANDTIYIGDSSTALYRATMGILGNGSSSCVLGLGPVNGEISGNVMENGVVSPVYDNTLILLKNGGYIRTLSYSLWFTNTTTNGLVLYGGLDGNLYQGNLTRVPIVGYFVSDKLIGSIGQQSNPLEVRIMLHGVGVSSSASLCTELATATSGSTQTSNSLPITSSGNRTNGTNTTATSASRTITAILEKRADKDMSVTSANTNTGADASNSNIIVEAIMSTASSTTASIRTSTISRNDTTDTAFHNGSARSISGTVQTSSTNGVGQNSTGNTCEFGANYLLSVPVLLDTTEVFSYLPSSIVNGFAARFGMTSYNGYWASKCDLTSTIYFNFSGAVLSVSMTAMLVESSGVLQKNISFADGSPVCLFALVPQSGSNYVLGTSLLTLLYTVFDLEHNELALAYTNSSANTLNIDLAAPITSRIPNASRAALYSSTSVLNNIQYWTVGNLPTPATLSINYAVRSLASFGLSALAAGLLMIV